MRVTAETRFATRERILEVAQELFAAKGFEATTTRDIAREAGIGVGTLFNYFPTKEAVVVSLVAAAVDGTHQRCATEQARTESLEEELFTFVAAGLRKLKPLRRNISAVLETVLSPLVADTAGDDTQSLRASHLEAVNRIARLHGFHDLTPMALHLYWALYTGLLLFWANDQSPRQEDTLALLDQSLEMFVSWLKAGSQNISTKNPR